MHCASYSLLGIAGAVLTYAARAHARLDPPRLSQPHAIWSHEIFSRWSTNLLTHFRFVQTQSSPLHHYGFDHLYGRRSMTAEPILNTPPAHQTPCLSG